nr:putative reverse transcriptase domain-containing protein [Tanacetum cinerariifolium]
AAPFEVLYGRNCRSPVYWSEVGDSQLTGPKLIRETIEKIVQIKNRLLTTRSRQKSYSNVRHKPMEFKVGNMVMLKVSPWKGVIRFGKCGKLSPRTMSSPNHPTSNIKDAFSSNFLDYTTALPGNISPDPPDNLSNYLFALLAISPFHNVQAYNAVANEPPIPP